MRRRLFSLRFVVSATLTASKAQLVTHFAFSGPILTVRKFNFRNHIGWFKTHSFSTNILTKFATFSENIFSHNSYNNKIYYQIFSYVIKSFGCQSSCDKNECLRQQKVCISAYMVIGSKLSYYKNRLKIFFII